MRLLVLIVIGVVGFYGWQAYKKDPQFLSKYVSSEPTEAQSAETAENPSEAGDRTGTPAVPAPPAPPTFVSKIAVPAGADGSAEKLPPGQFLVLERVSVETKDGVTAIVAGDLVKLMERRPNGTLQVTNGKYDFVVKESQVTQDVSTARDAERREFQKRYGALR
jgi:uncharacterized protein YlzI (FlbEa/FlbD family)